MLNRDNEEVRRRIHDVEYDVERFIRLEETRSKLEIELTIN
jgi:hypothetical protein